MNSYKRRCCMIRNEGNITWFYIGGVGWSRDVEEATFYNPYNPFRFLTKWMMYKSSHPPIKWRYYEIYPQGGMF